MIETIADIVRTYAKGRKERLVADTTHLLVAVRDGRLVAALSCDDLSALLRFADTAAAGYGADSLAVVIEGVFPMVEENPVTERPWERGEAEKLWLEHDGAAMGWVSEVAITTIAFRDGSTHVEGWPFHIHDDSVVWGEVPMSIPVSGLAELLVARLDGPIMDPARVPDPGDSFAGDPENGPFYDSEFGRVALDIGCTRILGNQLRGHGEAFLVVDSDQQADHLISEGLPNWQVEVCATPMRKD